MKDQGSLSSIWLVRAGIAAFVTIYLLVFDISLIHGDAMRVVAQIEADDLIWNPNHLLFDPIGFYWFKALEAFGVGISPLDSFEVLGGIATIVSLWIFDSLLLVLGVRSVAHRLVFIGGLFASRNFLSMAVSQYYFMIQMPFLLLSLKWLIQYAKHVEGQDVRTIYLYGSGVVVAIAAGIEFNNVLLAVMMGLGLAAFKLPRAWVGGMHFWLASALVGFPIFVIGFWLSGVDASFFSWVLAYQGEPGSELDNYWGLQWTPGGLALAGSKVGFNWFLGNILETAGFGTWLKVIVFGETLEFHPEVMRLVLVGILMPVVIVSTVILSFWLLKKVRNERLPLLLGMWIASYLVFNFFWSTGSDLFWFQTLPAVWVAIVIGLGFVDRESIVSSFDATPSRTVFVGIFAVVLLTANTIQTVIPQAWADVDVKGEKYRSLLREGDLEIIPGWDSLSWMVQSSAGPTVQRLILMNMVLQPKESPEHITHLPQLVDEHLGAGGRVVVARLYDKDSIVKPWYRLSEAGWPREKILAALDQYCTRAVGTVGDVTLRELYRCQPEALPEEGR